jgi:predicted RNase H-like nuclease (RuvC/YqgF family)
MTDEVETEADPLKKLDPNEYWGGSFERETAGDAEVDAYIRKLEAENTELFAKLGEARAEIAKLREALERIKDASNGWCRQIARAALQDGPGTATYNQRWKSKS